MATSKNKFNLLKRLKRTSVGEIPLSEVMVKIGLILSLIIVIPLMFPTGRSFKYSDLTVGSIANKKVIAPFPFAVLKTDEEYDKEKSEAKNIVPYFFTQNDTINRIQMHKMENLITYLGSIAQELSSSPVKSQIISNQDSTASDSLSLENIQIQIRNEYKLFLREDDLSNILNTFRGIQGEAVGRKILTEFRKLITYQYMNLRKSEILNNKMVLLIEGVEEDVLLSDFKDTSEN